MFATKKQLKDTERYLSAEIERAHNRYWELWRAHRLLLEKLGLDAIEIPATTILREKGEPEKG